jgi:hypothetical protein
MLTLEVRPAGHRWGVYTGPRLHKLFVDEEFATAALTRPDIVRLHAGYLSVTKMFQELAEQQARERRRGHWVHDKAFNDRVESQEWEREQGRE